MIVRDEPAPLSVVEREISDVVKVRDMVERKLGCPDGTFPEEGGEDPVEGRTPDPDGCRVEDGRTGRTLLRTVLPTAGRVATGMAALLMFGGLVVAVVALVLAFLPAPPVRLDALAVAGGGLAAFAIGFVLDFLACPGRDLGDADAGEC
ncbi:hypothetical protein BLEM_2288 [Bifidobacterium lemurum]|uniref:Uncharacterized protein n=1 Tax=Bifidobacterium lemurum TaxID=1603886 RepID=A0A261FJW2_9BIFI|nr:hypothetical protein [Bifidobacterium lemurum]OZG59253.1 hypothetical protein BLEM_2288 [Bifidobacterium lemurum]QOL33901.1 hypothetical protein BL8807_09045 [Bifidobacterium lemurum]